MKSPTINKHCIKYEYLSLSRQLKTLCVCRLPDATHNIDNKTSFEFQSFSGMYFVGILIDPSPDNTVNTIRINRILNLIKRQNQLSDILDYLHLQDLYKC